jgi:hypothetical protein
MREFVWRVSPGIRIRNPAGLQAANRPAVRRDLKLSDPKSIP